MKGTYQDDFTVQNVKENKEDFKVKKIPMEDFEKQTRSLNNSIIKLQQEKPNAFNHLYKGHFPEYENHLFGNINQHQEMEHNSMRDFVKSNENSYKLQHYYNMFDDVLKKSNTDFKKNGNQIDGLNNLVTYNKHGVKWLLHVNEEEDGSSFTPVRIIDKNKIRSLNKNEFNEYYKDTKIEDEIKKHYSK